jgi:hypothetical protein
VALSISLCVKSFFYTLETVIQHDPARMEEERTIVTYNPEEEIWYYFSKLTRLQYVIQQLKQRVDNNFYGLDTNAIMNTKTTRKSKSCIDTYTPLSENSSLESNAEEISHTARQAIEIYRASQSVSMYAKPILLYYCYRRLAHILFLATYESNFQKAKKSDSHGLTRDHTEKDNIICMPAGTFVRLQDSYYQDPQIYLEGAIFKWQDLLEPPTQRFYIFENMVKDPQQYRKDILRKKNMLTDNRVRVKESKSNSPDYVIHELARELMFTYAMSMLARYDILKWKDFMDGKQDNIMWNIEGYLKSTQSFFPNLIFNEIHRTRYFFYPESRSAPDEPTF